jgi:pimeloyl-ACP methyl ester carboxylesterase
MRNLPAAAVLALAINASLAVAQTVPPAVVSDPSEDKAFPAEMQVVAIPSHGSSMNGVLYLAGGAGTHPTLLLMHGFPGNEQNLDLAQSVRRAGWNVLTFHYRGAWGSEGAFSFSNAVEDADSAIAFLRDPANAKKYRIDPHRIAVAGHSMGGFMAAHAGAFDRGIIGVAMISSWDIGAWIAEATSAQGRADKAAWLRMGMVALAGCTPESLAADALAHQTEWNFINYAGELAERPLLLVNSDDGTAPNSKALAAAVQKVGGGAVTEVHLATDHSYSGQRIALQAAVVGWLETLESAKR